MKLTTSLKTLAACVALGCSMAASASTVYDTVSTTFSIAPTNTQAYVGTVDAAGFDMWNINLTAASGLVINLTTAQDNGPVPAFTQASAISTLKNITSVELFDSAMTSLGTAAATYTLNGTASYASLGSSVYFSLANAFLPGVYHLKISGDSGTAYSGSVSAVPLPGAALLFGSALMGLGALRRKKGNTNTSVVAA